MGVISKLPGRILNVRKATSAGASVEPFLDAAAELGNCQRTLKNAIRCSGVGLHSGRSLSMTLRPAPVDTGIVFHRIDLPEQSDRIIPALWDQVVDTRLCTTIGNASGATVGTVEHLMAALAGCGVDNLIVEIDGPEVPVMDGSAAPFVFLVECAGLYVQDAPRQVIRVLRDVVIEDGDRKARLSPADGFSVHFEIDFDSPVIAAQSAMIAVDASRFKAEVSRARTFGFLEDVAKLHAAGLAKGGSLDNAVVLSGDKILNEGGLRYEDEFVRHKILDSIGDLYMAGRAIQGRFHGVRAGHEINNRLLRALFDQPDAWALCSADAAPVAQNTPLAARAS